MSLPDEMVGNDEGMVVVAATWADLEPVYTALGERPTDGALRATCAKATPAAGGMVTLGLVAESRSRSVAFKVRVDGSGVAAFNALSRTAVPLYLVLVDGPPAPGRVLDGAEVAMTVRFSEQALRDAVVGVYHAGLANPIQEGETGFGGEPLDGEDTIRLAIRGEWEAVWSAVAFALTNEGHDRWGGLDALASVVEDAESQAAVQVYDTLDRALKASQAGCPSATLDSDSVDDELAPQAAVEAAMNGTPMAQIAEAFSPADAVRAAVMVVAARAEQTPNSLWAAAGWISGESEPWWVLPSMAPMLAHYQTAVPAAVLMTRMEGLWEDLQEMEDTDLMELTVRAVEGEDDDEADGEDSEGDDDGEHEMIAPSSLLLLNSWMQTLANLLDGMLDADEVANLEVAVNRPVASWLLEALGSQDGVDLVEKDAYGLWIAADDNGYTVEDIADAAVQVTGWCADVVAAQGDFEVGEDDWVELRRSFLMAFGGAAVVRATTALKG